MHLNLQLQSIAFQYYLGLKLGELLFHRSNLSVHELHESVPFALNVGQYGPVCGKLESMLL